MTKLPCMVLGSGLLVTLTVWGAQLQPQIFHSGLGLYASTPLTGASYCAMQESETIRTLVDGAHITNKSKSKFCRDFQGRTRTEYYQVDWNGGEEPENPSSVNISDPVEQVQYVLD